MLTLAVAGAAWVGYLTYLSTRSTPKAALAATSAFAVATVGLHQMIGS